MNEINQLKGVLRSALGLLDELKSRVSRDQLDAINSLTVEIDAALAAKPKGMDPAQAATADAAELYAQLQRAVALHNAELSIRDVLDAVPEDRSLARLELSKLKADWFHAAVNTLNRASGRSG